jgi:hypothetical protein
MFAAATQANGQRGIGTTEAFICRDVGPHASGRFSAGQVTCTNLLSMRWNGGCGKKE